MPIRQYYCLMRYAELFAGGGGLSLGLERAGWRPAWHAEIAEHPRAVLRHRWPGVPLYGDVTQLDGRALVREHGPIDALTGGSPCQDMSVAGKRVGLDGSRSGLFYEQMRLWDETGAPLCLWENVLGALSSNGGKDFAAVLAAFVGCEPAQLIPRDTKGRERKWSRAGVVRNGARVAAWRVIDCQYFGPPQRRVRVFVLGSRCAAHNPEQILLEPESVRGNFAPRRASRKNATARTARGIGENGRAIAFHMTQDPVSGAECAPTLGTTSGGMGVACVTGDVTHALTHEGADASEDGTGPGGHIVAKCVTAGEGQRNDTETCTLPVQPNSAPRRLTPRECERLMGWPDDWTLVPDAKGKPLSDAARYKICGNGVASPVAHWIALRVNLSLADKLENAA